MLPSSSHIESHLSLIGATPESIIVLYDGKANLWASRGLWALDVYGHEDTKLLDGVWTKWSAEGREISTTTPTVKTSSYKFSGSPNTSIIAGWEEVLASVGDPSKLVCDTRTAEEYSGKDARAVLMGFGRSDEDGLATIEKIKGIRKRNPTKNLVPLNVIGPI